MNIGNIHANFCPVDGGVIEYTDYADYRDNSHFYADPFTGLVDMEHFKRKLTMLSCADFWHYLKQFDKEEIRTVNICPSITVNVKNSKITRLPCETCKNV
jgi:hypothetical protein